MRAWRNLVDARDLGSRGGPPPWGFESPRSHYCRMPLSAVTRRSEGHFLFRPVPPILRESERSRTKPGMAREYSGNAAPNVTHFRTFPPLQGPSPRDCGSDPPPRPADSTRSGRPERRLGKRCAPVLALSVRDVEKPWGFNTVHDLSGRAVETRGMGLAGTRGRLEAPETGRSRPERFWTVLFPLQPCSERTASAGPKRMASLLT